MEANKYYLYRLTTPFISNKIYKSSSLKNIIKKCYLEFKNSKYYNTTEYFGITNLDKNVEYTFKKTNIDNNIIDSIEDNIINKNISDTEMVDLFDNIDINYINKKYKTCTIL